MIPARQSTAFETAIGPVLDAGGVAVTDCVVGDFKIKKTSGNFAALNGSATLTHVSAGMYDLVLTTSDVDTVGLCCIAIDDTVNACLPLFLQVIEEAVYDAFYAASATGLLPANVTQIGGDAQSATDLKDFADAGYDPSTNKVQGVVLVDTTTTNADMRGTDSAATAAALATAQADLDILTGTNGVTLATSQPNYAPATSAQATAIEADTQDLQTQIGTAGVGLTGIPKTGYKLASDGLDTVATTSPAGVASNFREMVVATWRYLYKKTTLTATQLKAYDDAGTSAIATMTVSDDGSTQTKGEAS